MIKDIFGCCFPSNKDLTMKEEFISQMKSNFEDCPSIRKSNDLGPNFNIKAGKDPNIDLENDIVLDEEDNKSKSKCKNSMIIDKLSELHNFKKDYDKEKVLTNQLQLSKIGIDDFLKTV